MRKNDLFLFPPLEEHQFENSGREKVENLYVGFSLGGDTTYASEGPLRLEPLGESLTTGLRDLAGSFKGMGDESAFRNQALIFGILYRVLDLIDANPTLAPGLRFDKNEILAEKARRYLESNIHRTISVEDVAAKFFLSPHYFAKKFKAETGMGIKEYHNQARLEKAMELLQDPLLSVSDVAQKLGFSNVNYFTNKFRERYGMPPTGIRKTRTSV
jgi:AraC-like DNA-binding protein